MRLTRPTAISELPPVSKKSSCVETVSRFISFFHISLMRRSVMVRGATNGRSWSSTSVLSDASKALTSILPLAVTGSLSSTTTLFGIM